MIYLDTSVLLARVLAEDACPPDSLWDEYLIASRLLVYEVHARLHREPDPEERLAEARLLLGRVRLVEMAPPVLARALEPFPVPLRTLDALHLATADFLRSQGSTPRMATYDERLRGAAKAMGFRLREL